MKIRIRGNTGITVTALAIGLTVALFPITGRVAAPSAATAPSSEQSLSPEQIIASLTERLAWYREARAVMRGGEAVFAREDEQTILAVVRHAFETARAQAALLATGKGSAAQREGGGALSGKAAQLKAAIQGDEEGIDQLRRRLRAAPHASRPALQDALVAATNRLELDHVRLDFMTRLEESKVSSSDTEPDLGRQIQTLEEAVPELRSPSPAASATVVPASGTKGLVRRLVEVHHTRTSLDHLSQSTATLERNLAREIRDNRASMRPVMSQLQALTADPSPNGSLTEGQRAFRDLLQRSKQLGAVALALREESAVVRRFVGDLETWKSALGREGWLILQNLGIGLIGVVIALAAILVGGALWRVAAERYVQDTYRRRLLLLARKVVVGTAMALVLVFHFASELTSLITGLGFAAAGIAFALQTVILALAGYFSMVAPNGIRVGDRVSLQGPFGYVQGEVLDIGLVRIRLRELEGEPLRPTGRIVVFPNSVVFTGSFFKLPPSGDRGEGPRPVERSAAA